MHWLVKRKKRKKNRRRLGNLVNENRIEAFVLFLVFFLAFENRISSRRKISLILSHFIHPLLLQAVSAGWMFAPRSGSCDRKTNQEMTKNIATLSWWILYFIYAGWCVCVKINIESMFACSASCHNMRNCMNDPRCWISAIYAITRPPSRYFYINQKPVQCNAHSPYIIVNAFFSPLLDPVMQP